MRNLTQAWWAPFAAVLVVAEMLIAQAFLFGNGTSNLLDAESTAARTALSLGGAVALVTGLWTRPKARWLGNTFIIAGAALATIWVWTIVMPPVALVVIAGVVLRQVRTGHRSQQIEESPRSRALVEALQSDWRGRPGRGLATELQCVVPYESACPGFGG